MKANPTLRVPKSCCADTNFASCQNASMPATHIHSKVSLFDVYNLIVVSKERETGRG